MSARAPGWRASTFQPARPPGSSRQEYNKIGYWRVYGTRVRYRTAAGTAGSFGIYSLISWRGQWYIVHFGPINHPSSAGAYVP